jgi:phenylacetate-CoA ligase
MADVVTARDEEVHVSSAEFWNPKTETLAREDLRALQLAKLRYVAQWAEARSPFYRRSFARAGFRSDQLKTFRDLARIPLLTRDEWMNSQLGRPPFGELPAAGPAAAIRLHTTSGTSGRTPLRALDSRKDWCWTAEMWCYALWAVGVRAGDIGYVGFGYGSFIGFWGLHNGLEKIGALTVPGGAQTTAQRVRQIVDFDATVVASTPTYALRLAQEARALGIDLPGSKVHTVILSGEPAGSIPETKALIEEHWGAKAYDTAGMTEISTIFMFEPKEQPGGCHVIEDHFIEEVLDPATDEELPYGEPGERVCTSFGRSMIPLLRYRTADLVVKVPHTAATSGRTWDLYQGGILGRVDDMKLVRGTNVYPRTVESIVRGFPEIEEFQIELVRADIRDEIILHVELVPGVGETRWMQIYASLRRELADAHEGLQFRVERADEGSLPRFELKARRLTDRRPASAVPATTVPATTVTAPATTAPAPGAGDADARRRGDSR